MADSEQKALQLMAEAEKKLTTSKGFLSSLFGCVIFHVNFCDEKIDSIVVAKLLKFFCKN